MPPAGSSRGKVAHGSILNDNFGGCRVKSQWQSTLFPQVIISEDDARRRWWRLEDVPYIQHRVLADQDLAALDLAIQRAGRDGAETEVAALQRLRDRLAASVQRT